jgi:peroxiredoxin
VRAALAVAVAVLAVAVVAVVATRGGDSPEPVGAEGLPGALPAGATLAPEDTAAPRAADFELTLADGTLVQASELWATRPLVVQFVASWCGRCADAQSGLNELAEKYRDLVAFLAVAPGQDTQEALAGYQSEHGTPYPAGVDDTGDIYRRYAVAEPPVVVVIGRGGHILRGWTVDVPKGTLDEVLAGLASRS